jgi:ribonuclease G
MSVVRELLLHANTKGLEVALLENNKLTEYHLDSNIKDDFCAGNIFLGRIKKLNPSLNAAFVDIGCDKDAFIHYSDLSPQLISLKKYVAALSRGNYFDIQHHALETQIPKDGKISEVLTKGDYVLCQILKESISTKGPRLSCELSLPGRYIVLTPFGNAIGISKKIENEDERSRLHELIKSIKPENFGVIVRTNAEGVDESTLKQDIVRALQKWETIARNITKQHPPLLLFAEHSKSFTLIRDLINDSYEKVITDNVELFDELKTYIDEHVPALKDIVALHKEDVALFDSFDIHKQLKTSFGKTVNVKQGSYIILEHTEALHVIDVNSGPKVKNDVDQDTNAFNINSEAAYEIARQLRLRDIGGIIVIDFIDMKSQAYKNQLLDIMHQAMSTDKAKHALLPISKFGLMEITRQRVRTQIDINVNDNTLSSVQPWDFVEKINQLLDTLENNSTIHLHPIIAAYFGVGKWQKWKRFFKYKKWITIMPDGTKDLFEYKIM